VDKCHNGKSSVAAVNYVNCIINYSIYCRSVHTRSVQKDPVGLGYELVTMLLQLWRDTEGLSFDRWDPLLQRLPGPNVHNYNALTDVHLKELLQQPVCHSFTSLELVFPCLFLISRPISCIVVSFIQLLCLYCSTLVLSSPVLYWFVFPYCILSYLGCLPLLYIVLSWLSSLIVCCLILIVFPYCILSYLGCLPILYIVLSWLSSHIVYCLILVDPDLSSLVFIASSFTLIYYILNAHNLQLSI